MSPAAPVWVVASAGTTRRWAAALDMAGVPALPLAWSEILAAGDGVAPAEHLAAHPTDLVLLTSPSALQVLPEDIGKGREAACVGAKTAAAAEDRGFTVRLVGRGTGEDLARELIDRGPPERLLFLRGRDVRREGLTLLDDAGWSVTEIEVYEARVRAAFAGEVALAPEPRAFVVGSPRGAEALEAALAASGRERLRRRPAIGVGVTTTQRLVTLAFPAVGAPDVPGVEGLVARVQELVP